MTRQPTRAEMLTELEFLRKQQIKQLDDSVFIPMTTEQMARDEERSRRIEMLRRELLRNGHWPLKIFHNPFGGGDLRIPASLPPAQTLVTVSLLTHSYVLVFAFLVVPRVPSSRLLYVKPGPL
jgi:hypothetical protein